MTSISRHTLTTRPLTLDPDTNLGGKGFSGLLARIVAWFSFSKKEIRDLESNRFDVTKTASKIVAKANELLNREYGSYQAKYCSEERAQMNDVEKAEHIKKIMARDDNYKDKLHEAIIKVTRATYSIVHGIDQQSNKNLTNAINKEINNNEEINSVTKIKTDYLLEKARNNALNLLKEYLPQNFQASPEDPPKTRLRTILDVSGTNIKNKIEDINKTISIKKLGLKESEEQAEEDGENAKLHANTPTGIKYAKRESEKLSTISDLTNDIKHLECEKQRLSEAVSTIKDYIETLPDKPTSPAD